MYTNNGYNNTMKSFQTFPLALIVCRWMSQPWSSCHPLSHTTVAGVPFPRNFLSMAKTILKRLFRVYAHIYHQHFPQVIQLEEEAHLNTSFKHFIFFVQEFGLVDKRELAPLQELIDKLTSKDRWGVACVRLELMVAYVMSWTNDITLDRCTASWLRWPFWHEVIAKETPHGSEQCRSEK